MHDEVSPCAGREPAKATVADKEQSSDPLRAKSFSSASRRLRLKHSSLPPIADEGIDVTVQHNETVADLEKRLAQARAERDEKVKSLEHKLQDVQREKQVAEDGRIDLVKAINQKERQVSDGAACKSSVHGPNTLMVSCAADAPSAHRQRICLRPAPKRTRPSRRAPRVGPASN